MRDRLTPGGVVATNVIGALTGGSSQITARALEDVRGGVPDGRAPSGLRGPGDRRPDDIRNIILVATERAAPTPARLAAVLGGDAARAGAQGAGSASAPRRDRWERDVVTGDVPLLTDGYAPTDALLIG